MQRINREGHPGLITYFDHFELGATFVIVMEYLGSDWVDLYDYIEMFGPIKESDSIILFKKIVEIVEFLHVDLGLCHNDIKGTPSSVEYNNLTYTNIIEKR